MSASDYVELRCRSAFSFLEAASNPEDLIQRAAELEHPTLALGDRDGLYGTPRFHQAARAAGIRAIVGAEITLDAPGAEPKEGGDPPPPRLLLLVEDPRGYRNLCRLLTRGHERGAKGEARVDWWELEEHAAGLTALARAAES